MSPADNAFLKSLAAALSQAFLGAGGVAVLPPGCRDDVVSLLTRCAVNPDYRAAYLEVLNAERQRQHLEAHIEHLPAREIPEEEIVRNGFGNLDDDTLADLAIDPAAIDILARVLTSVPEWRTEPHDVGEWFDRAAEREYGQRDDPSSFPEPVPIRRPGDTLPPREFERRRRSRVRLLMAVATALVVGLATGFFLARGKPDPVGGREIVIVQAVPKDVRPRGPGVQSLEVEVESPRAGFVTVVVPRPAGRSLVYPEPSAEDMRIPEKQKAVVGPYDARVGGTVLVLVTQSPAAETVRKALDRLGPGEDNNPQTLQQRLTDALFAAGHRWVVVAPTDR